MADWKPKQPLLLDVPIKRVTPKSDFLRKLEKEQAELAAPPTTPELPPNVVNITKQGKHRGKTD